MKNTSNMLKQIRIIVTISFVVMAVLFISFEVLDSKIEIEKGPQEKVEPLLNLSDLGFGDSEATESYERSLLLNSNDVGKCTTFITSLGKDELGFFSLDIYKSNGKIEFEDFTKEIIGNEYTDFKKNESGCIGSACKFPDIKYESALESMLTLDNKEWNCDAGYSAYDLNSNFNILFVVIKDKIAVIEFNNIDLNEERIEVLKEVIKN